MRKNFTKALLFCAVTLLGFACQKTEVGGGNVEKGISFTSTISTESKATDTAFETGDQIGVTAFSDADFMDVYADNVVYEYNASGSFISENPITYPAGNSLGFVAFYPQLTDGYSEELEFEVKADQSDYKNYTLSDLMTAQLEPTTSLTPELSFNHKLSRIIVTLTSDANLDGAVVKFTNVQRTVSIYLPDDMFEGYGATSSITLCSNGTNSYKGILAPQTIAMGTEFVSVELGGQVYTAAIEGEATVRSGKQYTYAMELDVENATLSFDAKINPWEDDELFEKVVEFTDEKFEAAVLAVSEGDITDEYYTGNIPQQIDANADGQVSMAEAAAVTQIGMPYAGAADLNGIECFVNLETLLANGNNFGSIDLSSNTELKKLDLNWPSEANLTALDVTKNTKLEYLDITGNKINGIDLSKNTELETLLAGGGSNVLGALDFTNNSKLVNVDVENVAVTSLNVANCEKLFSLRCGGNDFTELNLSSNTELNTLNCVGSELTSLNVTNCTKLVNLSFYNSKVSAIDLSKCTALENLYAENAELSTLDLAANTAIRNLEVEGNRLSALDVTTLANLSYVTCGMQTTDGSEAQELTLTLTQAQVDAGVFNADDSDNSNVVTEIPGEGGGEEPGTEAVITTALADISSIGTYPAGTWVITDETASSYSNFDGLRNALKASEGEVTLEFPNLTSFPNQALGKGSGSASSLVNLVAIYAPKATVISTDSFSYAANLHTIYCPAATKVNDYPMYGCNSLRNLTLCTTGQAVLINGYALNGITNAKANLTLTTGSEEVTGLAISQNTDGSWSWHISQYSALVFKEIIVVDAE